MQNIVDPNLTLEDVIKEDPYDGYGGKQAPIYLVLDWVDGTVGIETQFGDGVSERVFNHQATQIRLPDNVFVGALWDDVEELLPRLEKIRTGYEPYYDGRNYRGSFSDEARAELEYLKDEIENRYEQKVFRVTDRGGLWGAEYWIEDDSDITAETTDEEIVDLAEYHFADAYSEGILINGGVGAVIDRLKEIRARRIDDGNEDNE